MDKKQVLTLAMNILNTNNKTILASGINIPKMNPCILCKGEIIGSEPYGPIKEFTMATCGCIYHQMCLERDLIKRRGKAICPNWDCKGREIETSISPAVLQDKPSTADENTISKPVDSGNQTPVDDDVTLMGELELLGGEEQSS